MTHSTLCFESPLGWIHIIANPHGIVRIDFLDAAPISQEKSPNTDKIDPHITTVLSDTQQQLLEYFAGKRQTFDLPLAPEGTDFQKSVWTALNTIPFGSTCTYKDIAIQVNRPKGSQAIGQANGKNPISIVVPCHRVIGSNGKLTGYAGGLDRKAALLRFEKETASDTRLI